MKDENPEEMSCFGSIHISLVEATEAISPIPTCDQTIQFYPTA
jgi:hypothetical protein